VRFAWIANRRGTRLCEGEGRKRNDQVEIMKPLLNMNFSVGVNMYRENVT